MQDLSCAPALCTVDLSTLGDTGENLKRMQGTGEFQKLVEAVTSTEREANSAVVRRIQNGGASF